MESSFKYIFPADKFITHAVAFINLLDPETHAIATAKSIYTLGGETASQTFMDICESAGKELGFLELEYDWEANTIFVHI